MNSRAPWLIRSIFYLSKKFSEKKMIPVLEPVIAQRLVAVPLPQHVGGASFFFSASIQNEVARFEALARARTSACFLLMYKGDVVVRLPGSLDEVSNG